LASSQVYALSIHADYRCRHSGRCCSADWDVPVELPIYRSLSAAVTAGRLNMAPEAGSLVPFIVEDGLPDDAAAMLERTEAGNCIFFERESRLCVVHRDLGEEVLPATCRHFPRVAVRDVRGTFVTLSHFCPTAASLLFRDDVPLAIVTEPRAFPPADYEGLTVGEDDLPPLLHPHMLMDPDGYSAWEEHMVARCADPGRSPESVLSTLARDAGELRTWRPGGSSLRQRVAALPSWHVESPAHATLDASRALYADAMSAVPPELRPAADDDGLEEAFQELVRCGWAEVRTPLNRFIAAKAFASWTAYQGRGVLTIVRGLEAAIALVRVEAARHCRDQARGLDNAILLEAFRSADFILNHLAVGEDLAEEWSKAEE
jgi:Fe-S-cluster containining protein